MKIGVFGGSFDPPHVGHLIVADDAAAALRLDRVVFVPAGTHPLKAARAEASAELRLQMIVAATEGWSGYEVDDREVRRPGLSYTVDTLKELGEKNPRAELVLLVGSDILGELDRWERVSEVAELARIAVVSRGDTAWRVAPAIDLDFVRVPVTDIAISSSDVRWRIRAGRPWRHLVPRSVYDIIIDNQLYIDRDVGEATRKIGG